MKSVFSRLRFRLATAVLGTGLLCGAARAESSVTNPVVSAVERSKSELFLSAQAAYDDGRYAEAAGLYGQLASNGVNNVELDYNRANACFKNRDLPEAVLNYRSAWYKAPRDPDIRANLHFALNAAGATETVPTVYERLFSVLSKTEWVAAAVVGYLILTLILLLCLILRRARRVLLRSCILPGLLLLLSAGGWHYWRQLEYQPEWVVVRTGATALFGPIEGTTAHYKVPRAALVRQRATDPKGWIEIEYDGKKGWLQRQYIERVYP